MTGCKRSDFVRAFLLATSVVAIGAVCLAPAGVRAQDAEQSDEPTPMVIEGPEPTTADELLEAVREG
ncbi:MAG TPA: hypothetical protein VKA74_19005, partial [Myxococcota bacterium]|nr:hypothetical protein [Myxococcota bacterium]